MAQPIKAPNTASNKNGRYRGGPGGRDNRNALRHGLKSGKLPAGCAWVEIRVNRFRRELEDAVVKLRGRVTMTDAALIRAACEHEKRHCLAQRWLRESSTKLKPMELLAFSKEVSASAESVGKAIALLNLDAAEDDLVQRLYSRVPKMIEHHEANAANESTQPPE